MQSFKFTLDPSENESMSNLSKKYDFSSITNDAVEKGLTTGGFQFTSSTNTGFSFSSPVPNASEPIREDNSSNNKVEGRPNSKKWKSVTPRVDTVELFRTNELATYAVISTTRFCNKYVYLIVSKDTLYYYKNHESQLQQPDGFFRFYPSTTVSLNDTNDVVRVSNQGFAISIRRHGALMPVYLARVELVRWQRALWGAVAVARREWQDRVFAKYLVFLGMEDCALNAVIDLRVCLFAFLLELEYT
jgi:hypothetical protein